MPKSHRHERIADLIREQIADILLREEELPDEVVVTVTRVMLSDDREHAGIAVSVLPSERTQDILTQLEEQAGAIQHLLNRRLRIRPVPRIRFVPETGVAEADHLEAELYKLQENP